MVVGMGWDGGWHGMGWWLAWDGGCRFYRIAEGMAWRTVWCSRLVVYGIGFAVGKVMWQWQWQQCGILVG